MDLEILITKLLYLSNNKLQIIGMSATLPNLNDIANWMNAKLYITSLRPIQLTQFYKLGDNIYDNNGVIFRNLKQIYQNDNDNVVQLCQEIISDSGSVLVFCEKKVWCKKCCKMISDVLRVANTIMMYYYYQNVNY